MLSKQTVCNSCSAEFEIEALEEDYPIQFCPACGTELEEDEAPEVDAEE